MLSSILFATILSIAWLIIDRLRLKDTFDIRTTWKKYVGALVAGVLYVFLKGLDVFQYLVIAGVMTLVAHSFDAVITWISGAITWVRAKFGSNKAA